MILKSFELNKLKLNNYNFYLFYGENEGLKEEIINNLFEKNYTNKVYRYEEKEILEKKNNFFNTVLTKSFFDDEKLIIINRATDKIKEITEELIQKKPQDIQFVLNAKNLEKKSTLRKLFEKDKQIICSPFYEDNINILIERSRGDRKNLNNELAKIENFSLNKKNINLEQVIRLTNLADNYGASELIDHCLAKNTRKTISILNENNYSDEDNIIIIRTLLVKLKRLVKIHESVSEKSNIEMAISSFKPPIFWKDKPLIMTQIKAWGKSELENLIYKTNEVEFLIKKNSSLGKNILFDFIIDNSKKINS